MKEIKKINDKVYTDIKNRYKRFFLTEVKIKAKVAEIPLKIEEIQKDKIRFELGIHKNIKTINSSTKQLYKKVVWGSLVSIIEFEKKFMYFSQLKLWENKEVSYIKKRLKLDYDFRQGKLPENLSKMFLN